MAWTLYKRGAVWWAVQTEGGVRERRSTRCTDRRAANAITVQWERDSADPRRHAAHSTTLESVMNDLIADRETRGRAKGTITMYEQKAAHVLRVLGRETRIADVGAAEIDHFTETRIAEGAHANTVSKELTAIRAALKIARRRGSYDKAVADVMPIGWAAKYVPRKRHLTPETFMQLLTEVARDVKRKKAPVPRPDRAAHVAFIVATGMRWSESVSAERDDVDLDALRVRVRGTKTEKSADPIVVPSAAAGVLRFALANARAEGRLFRPWASVRRDLAAACRRGGIEPVTPNDLRRTASSWMVQRGVPLFAVAKVLRHADTRMVERVYGQLPPADLARLLEQTPGQELAVSVVWQTPAASVESADAVDAGGANETTKTADPLCPGPGLNGGHADFQSGNESHGGTAIRSVGATHPGSVVSVACPGVAAEPLPATFSEALDAALSLCARVPS